MDQELYSQLVRTLLKIPGIEDQAYRTALLGPIPSQGLPRSSNTFTDISQIVLHLETLILITDKNALVIFLENAKSRVEGFRLHYELAELQRQIETNIQGKQTASNTAPAFNRVPPVVQPDVSLDETVAQSLIQPNTAALRDAMSLAYNLDELELLCTDLNISIENLGEGPLVQMIDRLIRYFQRRGRYVELVKKILVDRPHLIDILQESERSPKSRQDSPLQESLIFSNARSTKSPTKHKKRSVSSKSTASSRREVPHQAESSGKRLLIYKSIIQNMNSELRTQARSLTKYELEIIEGDLREIMEFVNELSSGEASELFRSRLAFLDKVEEAIMQLDVALRAWTHLERNGFDGEVQLQFYKYLKNCRNRLEEVISYLKV